MPILIMAAAAGLLYLVQLLLYKKLWDKDLDCELDLGSDRFIFVGDSIEIEETLENKKRLPLPWVYFKFVLAANGKPLKYHSDMFSVRNFTRIRRKRRIELTQRGLYTAAEINLVSHDLFLSKTFTKVMNKHPQSVTVYPRLINRDEWPVAFEALTGDSIARKIFPEDPYLFKGIRDYQSTDSLKNINFKASARNGEWKVNLHETTTSQKVCILLGMDKAARYYDPVLYEQAMRIAGTLASVFVKEGVPVELRSNGLDCVDNCPAEVAPGCGTEHIYDILGALARLDLEREEGSIISYLDEAREDPDANVEYILVTPSYRGGIKEAYERIAASDKRVSWIVPCTLAQSRDKYYEPNQYLDQMPNVVLWTV